MPLATGSQRLVNVSSYVLADWFKKSEKLHVL